MKHIQTGPETRAWAGTTVWIEDAPETLFVTPDGEELVRCRNGEKPDVIVDSERGLPEMELREWSGSKAQKLWLRGQARKVKET